VRLLVLGVVAAAAVGAAPVVLARHRVRAHLLVVVVRAARLVAPPVVRHSW